MGQEPGLEGPSGHAWHIRRWCVIRALRNHYIENKDEPLFLHTITKTLQSSQYLNKTLRDSDIKPVLEDLVKKGLVDVRSPGSWESYIITQVGLDWWNKHGKETGYVLFDFV